MKRIGLDEDEYYKRRSLLCVHGYTGSSGKPHPFTVDVCRKVCETIEEHRKRGYTVCVLLLTDLPEGNSRGSVAETMGELIHAEHPDVMVMYTGGGKAVDSITEVREVFSAIFKQCIEHFTVFCFWGHHFRIKYLYSVRGYEPAVTVAFSFRSFLRRTFSILMHLLWTIPNWLDPFGNCWWSLWVQERRLAKMWLVQKEDFQKRA